MDEKESEIARIKESLAFNKHDSEFSMRGTFKKLDVKKKMKINYSIK